MGFSSCGAGAQSLRLAGPRAWARQLFYMDLVAPQHVESSWTKDQTGFPCIGRQILIHCATREFPYITLYGEKMFRWI